MAQELSPERIESIGTVAGLVWQYLDSHDAVTLSKLAREIEAPSDLVCRGWAGWRRKRKSRFARDLEAN